MPHLLPDIYDKPDEDSKAHLFRTNGWGNTHAMPGNVKTVIDLLNLMR